MLHSARKITRSIFPAARGVACESSEDEDDRDDEGGCYSDDGQKSMLPTPSRRRTAVAKHGVKRSSRTTPGLHNPASSRDGRQPTYVRDAGTHDRKRPSQSHHHQNQRQNQPQNQHQNQHRNQRAANQPFDTATPTPVSRATSDDSGDGLQSDMSDYEGNQQILKMNGLLDVWDARGNPRWEEETFALCDLSRCRGCGKYYAPMRTLRHVCRV